MLLLSWAKPGNPASILYIHTYIHTYMHTCIHAYMHTCIHAYMHTYIHIYIYIYIYIKFILTCRHNIINSSASAPLNATKIAVKKVSDVDVCMLGPEL